MMGAQGSSLAAALLLAGARATPTPPPGPNCVGNNVPIANTSGLEPDCPALLEPHNASSGSPLVDDAAIEIFVDFAPNANGTDVWDVAVGFASKNGDRVPDGGKSAPMALKKTDKTLDLAVWTDHTVIEAFFMAGRSFWTIPLSCDAVGNNTKQGISVYANGTAKVKSATVYAVKSIWA